MTMLQVVSLILLWTAIAVEGALLVLLYRHVARLYAPKSEGLAVGASAPPLLAWSPQGKTVPLPGLLTGDRNLLVFGSPTCAGCQALLNDHDISGFLAARSLPSYFLTIETERSLAETPNIGSSLEVLAVEKKAFDDYDIPSMPFAYLLTRTGVVIARGSVGDGLQALMKLCDPADQAGRTSAQALIQVSPVHHASH